MGRPSKLTDLQWEKIGKRLLAGEKASALAKEFGVSKTAISVRFSERIETVKEVAQQIVATEQRMAQLPVADQIAARSLADELKAISVHLAGAAKFGAATAHRLAGIANMKVAEIDDAAPLDEDSLKALKGIAALTHTANQASEIALGLLKANKETVDKVNEQALEKSAPSNPERGTTFRVIKAEA